MAELLEVDKAIVEEVLAKSGIANQLKPPSLVSKSCQDT